MLKECNESELESLMVEHPDSIFYRVSRKPIFVKGVKSAALALAPSKHLHSDYTNGRITWEDYVLRYNQQITESRKAQKTLASIKAQAETADVYFVCFCGREKGEQCHRFLLLELVKEIP